MVVEAWENSFVCVHFEKPGQFLNVLKLITKITKYFIINGNTIYIFIVTYL